MTQAKCIAGLKCGSCDKECLYDDYPSSLNNCHKLPFFLWPDNNHLMKWGIASYLEETKLKHSSQRTVFIDFSSSHLREFLSDEWLEKFRGSRLILICDRKLSPLANYWYYSEFSTSLIAGIIYTNDDNTTINDKVFLAFNGRSSPPSRKMERLSINEFRVLQQFYKGMNAKKIALSYNYNVKTVYTYKTRIEKKLQFRLRNIC